MKAIIHSSIFLAYNTIFLHGTRHVHMLLNYKKKIKILHVERHREQNSAILSF